MGAIQGASSAQFGNVIECRPVIRRLARNQHRSGLRLGIDCKQGHLAACRRLERAKQLVPRHGEALYGIARDLRFFRRRLRP